MGNSQISETGNLTSWKKAFCLHSWSYPAPYSYQCYQSVFFFIQQFHLMQGGSLGVTLYMPPCRWVLQSQTILPSSDMLTCFWFCGLQQLLSSGARVELPNTVYYALKATVEIKTEVIQILGGFWSTAVQNACDGTPGSTAAGCCWKQHKQDSFSYTGTDPANLLQAELLSHRPAAP